MLADDDAFVAHRRDVGATGIDEVQAWQIVLACDFLRSKMFLDRHGEVGAAFDRRVVGDDDAFAARNAADPGDDACRRNVAAI